MADRLDDREAMAGRERRLARAPVAFLRGLLRRLAGSDDLAGLSDRDLSDIGAEREDVAARLDREMTRLQTRDFRSR